jgi:hypothetical protein
MKTVYKKLLRGITLITFGSLLSFTVKAATFTAVASGNFSSSLTWGGSVPGNILSTDIVIIPTGITVTLNQNLTISGSSTLTVAGTLTSGSNATALVVTGGSLTGSGTIAVDSAVLGISSGLTFAGTLAANELTSIGATVSSATTIMVGSTLSLNNGTLVLNSGSSLGVNSGATIMVNGGGIAVNGGTLNLTSSYDVQYSGSGSVTAGAELSGSGLGDVTVNIGSGASVSLSANTTVNGTLTLSSGNLSLNNYMLTLSASGDISASGSGAISASSGSGIAINSSGSLSGNLRFSTSGNTIGNLNINLGSGSANVNLGSDVTITGMLTLGQGSLSLNGYNLTLSAGGNVAASGSGSISTTTSSDITIATSGTIGGAIRFTAGSNTVDDLTINLGSGSATVSFGSNLTVNGTLDLQSGMINVGTNNLSVAAGGSVSGGSSTSYVITSGGGALTLNVGAGSSATFNVGTSTRFAPAVVTAASGSASSNISITTKDGVLVNGTSGIDLTLTQPLVNVTWNVVSSATSGLNLTLKLKWSSNMEVNTFNRNNAYITHYVGGSWDISSLGAATVEGSMYSMTRANINSLSPFAVADANAVLTSVPSIGNEKAAIVYPNPATNSLLFKTTGVTDRVDIFDVTGRFVKTVVIGANTGEIPVAELQPGSYMAKFYRRNFVSAQQFIKE